MVLLPVMGVLASITGLIKVSDGLFVFFMGIVLVAYQCDVHRVQASCKILGRFFVPCLLTLLANSSATGNGLSNLPAYAINSFSLVLGYSEDLESKATPSLLNDFRYFCIEVVLLLLIVVACTKGTGQRVTLAAVLICLAYVYSIFKEGFVRILGTSGSRCA